MVALIVRALGARWLKWPAVILAVLLGVWLYGQSQKNKGADEVRQQIEEQRQEAIEQKQEIDREIQALPDPELRRRASQWLR